MNRLLLRRRSRVSGCTVFLIVLAMLLALLPAFAVSAVSTETEVHVTHYIYDGGKTEEIFKEPTDTQQTAIPENADYDPVYDASFSESEIDAVLYAVEAYWLTIDEDTKEETRSYVTEAYLDDARDNGVTVKNDEGFFTRDDFLAGDSAGGSLSPCGHGFHIAFAADKLPPDGQILYVNYYYILNNPPEEPEETEKPEEPEEPEPEPEYVLYFPVYTPPEPQSNIGAELAEYITSIEVPEELNELIKSIDVTPANPDTARELEEFAANGGHDVHFSFEMTVLGYTGEVSELPVPILVTCPLSEDADTETLVVLTKHKGELEYTDGITIGEDGTFTAALQRFSTFSVASRTGNLLTTTVGEYGNMNPSGTMTIKAGDRRVFTFTPQQGYRVKEILLDGEVPELQSDGSLVVTGNGLDRTVEVSFEPIPAETETPLPDVGMIVDMPEYGGGGEAIPPVPREYVPPELPKPEAEPKAAESAEPEEERPPGIIFTPAGDGFVLNPVKPAEVVQGEGWSVLNLVLAIMGLFVPFAEFLASPSRKKTSSKSSQVLTLLVVVSGIVSCTLFTLLENLGSRYQAVNSNTPLFFVLFIIPAIVFTVLMLRNREKAKNK